MECLPGKPQQGGYMFKESKRRRKQAWLCTCYRSFDFSHMRVHTGTKTVIDEGIVINTNPGY